jgi:PST family polysaccharide transporter
LNPDKISIIKNFSYLVLTKGIDFIVPILLLPYLVNALGIEQFGLLSFALAIGIYFSSMMQYGYNISAVRAIARVRENKKSLSIAFSELLISSILVCVFFSTCYLLLFFIESITNEFQLYLGVLFFILMQSLFPAWLFQGLEKMHYIALSNSVCKFLYLVAVIFFVNRPEDTYLVPLMQGLSWFLALIIAAFIIVKKNLVSFTPPSWFGIKQTYVQGWPAFVTQFAPTLYSNSMTFLLGLFHGHIIVGIYSAAIRVIEIINGFAFLLINATLPHLARNMELHKWLKNIMIIAGVSLAILLFFSANWFAPLLFSEHSQQILTLIKIASLMIPFVFIRLAYGPAYLMLIGAEKTYQRIVFSNSLGGFILAWLLIPQWQVDGAIYVMLLTSILMTVFTLIAVKNATANWGVEK